MQLFFTDPDPVACAKHLDDSRVNKILMESAQIICTVLHGDGHKNLPMKPTHANHPVTLWVSEKFSHLNWVKEYHIALVNEKLYRTGTSHGCALPEQLLNDIRSTKKPEYFINYAKRDSLNLDFTWCKDTHRGYRLYLSSRWHIAERKPRWTKRNSPDWWVQPGDDEFIKLSKRAFKLYSKGATECPLCSSKIKKLQNRMECSRPNCLLWEQLR